MVKSSTALAMLLFFFCSSTTWAAESKSGSPAAWERTLAEAKKEGKVIIAAPPVPSHREALVKFQEAYPDIRLEYNGLAPVQYETRIAKERQLGQYLWDLIVTGIGSTLFQTQIPGGWHDPLKPALILPDVLDDKKWLGGFDAGFMDKGKRYAYAFNLNVTYNFFVNRDAIPEPALQKVEDLLDPRWKGKIAFRDPRISDAGTASLAHVRKMLGDEQTKKLLVDQQPVFTQDGRQLAEWVVRGRYPIGIALSFTDVARFQKEGVGLNVKRIQLPIERVTAGWGGVMLMNRAPNPNAAKVFLNWLLGKEAQAAFAKLGSVNSRRLDVEPGDPAGVVDSKKSESYLNFIQEENQWMTAEAIKFARELIK